MADDLLTRLREATEANYAGLPSTASTDRPEFGTRGTCPGGDEPTVPVRAPLVDASKLSGTRSQCARCDWYSVHLVGTILGGHRRVWRDEQGGLLW